MGNDSGEFTLFSRLNKKACINEVFIDADTQPERKEQEKRAQKRMKNDKTNEHILMTVSKQHARRSAWYIPTEQGTTTDHSIV